VNKVDKKEVPVRAIYFNTILTSPYPDRVLIRIPDSYVCSFVTTKRWSKGYYSSCVNRQLKDDAGRVYRRNSTHSVQRSRKYSLYFSLWLLLIHRLTLWYFETRCDIFQLSYAVSGRTFHFSLPSGMFDMFTRFKRKRDNIKIHARKFWVAVRMHLWIVICILSSGWIIVLRCFRWIINYVNLKGK
jgi:hypothetical protein